MMTRVSLAFCVLLIALLCREDSVLAGDNVGQASRRAIQAELQGLAARAQQFAWRPSTEGGGDHFFGNIVSMNQLTLQPVTANGRYDLLTLGVTSIVIGGTGKEMGLDGNPIRVDAIVYADSVAFLFYN